MPRGKNQTPLEDFEEHIVDIDVTSEMEESFLEYAYSVIYSRALPDARDGLKPVQRRILYMMSDMGLRPDRGHVKSARVVGEVMGKLHPHGDAAIYDAMVRMSQSFALRLPLVDGHGNFGSLDDGPAAPRYTEARLAAAALAMTDHLDEDVVDFVPNYDNQLQQPDVLPAAFPNLLVNGATGIAVGMATNMAPHNLGEVISAARHLIEHPDATLAEIMKFVPGPDLPSGGIIVGLDGIRDAYETGRGSFKTRAKVELEQISARKTGLVVTELPYNVGPEKVIEKIKDAANAKKLTGVSDVVDLTDRKNGLRLVIEIKNGFNPNAVLQQLYRLTPLEDSFGINNVALVDGQPQTLGLLELLKVYVEHRITVVRRRTSFRLGKKKDRLHLVEGLLLAIVDIDEVIQIIRASDDSASARARLMQVFDLTEIQANHILELRLRQLTKFSRIELEKEQEELKKAIEELAAILASEALLREVVSSELADISAQFATPRRTVLLKSAEAKPLKGTVMPEAVSTTAKAPLALEVEDTPCFAMLSATGLLARTADRTPLQSNGPRARHDVVLSAVPTSARGEIGALTNTGRLIRLQVVDMPVLPPTMTSASLATGVKASEFAAIAKTERIVALVSLSEVFALGTKNGVVKRVTPDYPLNRDDFEATTLKDGDEVINAAPAPDEADLLFITKNAQLLHFSAQLVRPQGRTAGGMAGIKLSDDDSVIFFGAVNALSDETVVVTIAGGTGAGSAKLTPLADFPAKGRATAGVRSHRFTKDETDLSLAWAGPGPALASSEAGVSRVLPTEFGKRDGSGVPLSQKVDVIGPAYDAAVPDFSAPGQDPEGEADLSGASAPELPALVQASPELPAPTAASRVSREAPSSSKPFASTHEVEEDGSTLF
ncbi:DNA gyrase/topoisomerase IV subunit A [Neomicrococcus aestuarii]|uniref:DNA topoisomerase (ATP-hydrolyzing) n=1 Tax=Neomicrococcus aestuarii TaxID=556325 RepID=A0A1L2ZKN9_9MICC|nr:DNA topoisomerase IV subunit A [Neomicrococcus aestuarii]APF39770.1 DNA topoisomerase IV [Neomicrococcus aestuarii]